MPESSNFISEKNAKTNKPIRLYRINISDTPGSSGESDLFLTDSNYEIDYYKTDSSVNSAQNYRPFPISLEGYGPNTEGKIDRVSLVCSNVSQYMEAFLEARDGLRGRKVTIREVFSDKLADAEAYREEIYYIDSVTSDASSVRFDLASKLDLLSWKLPKDSYNRLRCRNRYKGRGCWLLASGGYQAPTYFSTENYVIPVGETAFSAPNARTVEFHDFNLRGFNKTTDSLSVEVKRGIGTATANYTLIASSDSGATAHFTWTGSFDFTASYQEISVLFSAAVEVAGFDSAKFNYFQIDLSGNGAYYFRNVEVAVTLPSPAFTDSDSCDLSLNDCRRHNNVARFGGFPNIPDRKRIFV